MSQPPTSASQSSNIVASSRSTTTPAPAQTASPQAAPPVPPMRRVSQLVIGLWVPQAVHAAAELGVADVLAAGARTSAEVAAALGTHADSTDRLLRALVTLGLLATTDGDRFALTETGRCLVDDADVTVRAWSRLMGGPAVWDAWGRLTDCVRTGQTAWQVRAAASDAGRSGAGDPFESMARDPQAAAVFNRAMYDLTRGSAPAIASAVDWTGVRHVVDVGGGYGALLCGILDAQPALRGAVFDLPHARDGALACFASRGLQARASYVEGSLFADPPPLPAADAYVVKSVIHDWNDEKSLDILRACRAAMPAGARLLLVEPPAMPAGVNPTLDWMIAFSDLNMLVNCGGRERTEAQYVALLDAAGLRVTAIHPTSGFYRVFEAVRQD
jgi:hypothetical protein